MFVLVMVFRRPRSHKFAVGLKVCARLYLRKILVIMRTLHENDWSAIRQVLAKLVPRVVPRVHPCSVCGLDRTADQRVLLMVKFLNVKKEDALTFSSPVLLVSFRFCVVMEL